MKIKEHQNFTKWKFYFKDLEGGTLSFPKSGGYSPNLHELATEAAAQFEIFDTDTEGKYTRLIRKQAEHLGVDYLEYLKVIIEHQLCLRHETEARELCWNDGLGDKLHEFSGKIDHAIETFPKPLKKLAQAAVVVATKAATRKGNKKLGGCGTCGGTETFDPDTNNLGRAGSLNNLVPTSITKKRN